MIRVLSKKMLLFLGIMLSLQTFAAFIDNGSAKKDTNTINLSLKKFHKNSYKTTAYPDFKLSNFQFKGSTSIYQLNSDNAVVVQSFIHMEKGNTTYVYPYKYKVKVPLFKTPTAPNR